MRLPVGLCSLLLPSLLCAFDFFPLPDRAHDAVAHLKQAILAAERNITLITPSLEERSLRKALRRVAEKRKRTTLLTAPGNAADSAYLAQFASVDPMTLEGLCKADGCGDLQATVLLRDDAYACYSSLPLDHASLFKEIGFLVCTDTPTEVRVFVKFVQTQRERATAYLKP